MPIVRGVRRSLLTLAACAAALGPDTSARAYGPWGSYTMGGITFDRGTNGCLGPVGVDADTSGTLASSGPAAAPVQVVEA